MRLFWETWLSALPLIPLETWLVKEIVSWGAARAVPPRHMAAMAVVLRLRDMGGSLGTMVRGERGDAGGAFEGPNTRARGVEGPKPGPGLAVLKHGPVRRKRGLSLVPSEIYRARPGAWAMPAAPFTCDPFMLTRVVGVFSRWRADGRTALMPLVFGVRGD